MNHCWTCQGEHDPDDACVTGAREAPQSREELGPIFEARYNSRCPACDDLIMPGENIRYADTKVIHADYRCEEVALS